MKKIVLIVGGIVLVLAILLFVGRQIAIGYLTPDFLVNQMESRWKCRAHIESVDVRILGNATIVLNGVAIGKRDAFARRQTALADRTPMEKAEISVDSIRIEVRPLPLFFRQLDIRDLELDGAFFETAVRRTGKLSIERLFEEPGGGSGGKDGSAEPTAVRPEPGGSASETLGQSGAAEARGEEGDASPSPSEADETSPADMPMDIVEEQFNAGSLPVAMAADRVVFNRARAEIGIDASGARITLDDLQLTLTEIDVDPENLAGRNRMAFILDSNLIVKPREGDSEFVNAQLSGAGSIRPFDPVSGELQPKIASDLTIHGGSKLDTFPLVAKVREMLEKVDAAGIEFGDFNLSGELLADAKTRFTYLQPKLQLDDALKIELAETTLEVNPGSWMDTSDNTHEMTGALKASDELTTRIEGMVDAYLKEKAGAFASEGLRDTILNPLKVDGRVAVEVVSQGDLGDPKADIITPLGNLTEVIDTGKMLKDSLEEAGKSFLKGLLGGDQEKP